MANLTGQILFDITLNSSGGIASVTASASQKAGQYHKIAGNLKITNNTQSHITQNTPADVKMSVAIYNDSQYTGTPTYLSAILTDRNGDLIKDNNKPQVTGNRYIITSHNQISAKSSTQFAFYNGTSYTGLYGFGNTASATATYLHSVKHPLVISVNDSVGSSGWSNKYIKVWFSNSSTTAYGVPLGKANSDLAKAFISEPLYYKTDLTDLNITPQQQSFEL